MNQKEMIEALKCVPYDELFKNLEATLEAERKLKSPYFRDKVIQFCGAITLKHQVESTDPAEVERLTKFAEQFINHKKN